MHDACECMMHVDTWFDFFMVSNWDTGIYYNDY